MSLSSWVKEQIETRSCHHRLVWVHDPYELLETDDVSALHASLQPSGHHLLCVRNALQLRESLEGCNPAAARLVVLDQSYTLRDPHLLPKDAQPTDLAPLRAPDWKPLVDPGAIFTPTVRDFLCHLTGDPHWPAEVNIFPYEKLARDDPRRFIQAFDTFRRTGRSLCTGDLAVVGASAFFGVDLYDISQPLAALELAFHRSDSWLELENLFNTAEVELIRQRLQSITRPTGDLFGPNAENARMAVVTLLVLRQHFEEPGRHLPILSPSLAAYQDCSVGLCLEAPSWFVDQEVPRFEKLITQGFRSHLHNALELGDPLKARDFVQRERFSGTLRGLVPFAISTGGRKAKRAESRDDFSLERLVPEFQETKRRLVDLVTATKKSVARLHLTPLRDLSLAKILAVFDGGGFYQVDHLVGRLSSLMRDVEGPARRHWDTVLGFEIAWTREAREGRDAINDAGTLRSDLDYLFGKLIEARYAEMVPGEFLTTDQMYDKWIGPRRRAASGSVRKAVILLIDSMRLDIWRQLVKPALERDYAVEESLGLARLPSETRVSRRCFFAGKPPAEVPASGKESDFLAAELSRFYAVPTPLVRIRTERPGMVFGVESPDHLTYAAVFDFPDRLSHDVDWDPHMVQEALRPLIREVRAVLSQAGPDALVFIVSDHGHTRLRGGTPVYLDDADDVGYHAAYVTKRIEGRNGAHVFQIPAKTLGHATPGWYVFPKPGFYLRRAQDSAGRPGAGYRHGGLSLFEVVVPLAVLRHREAPTNVYAQAQLRGTAVAGAESRLEISLSADGVVTSPLKLVADSEDVESQVVSGVSSTPTVVTLRYLPAAPGRRSLKFTAYLGDDAVGSTSLEVDVRPAPVPEDAAKAKLRKLFGEV